MSSRSYDRGGYTSLHIQYAILLHADLIKCAQSGLSSQLDSMVVESLVIVDQNATVSFLTVHTARQHHGVAVHAGGLTFEWRYHSVIHDVQSRNSATVGNLRLIFTLKKRS